MSVTKGVVTNAYQLASSIRSTFTVKGIGGGNLLFNTVDTDDDTAIPVYGSEGAKQAIQYANVDTYIRHTGKENENWEIIIDDTGPTIQSVTVDGDEITVDGQPIQVL